MNFDTWSDEDLIALSEKRYDALSDQALLEYSQGFNKAKPKSTVGEDIQAGLARTGGAFSSGVGLVDTALSSVADKLLGSNFTDQAIDAQIDRANYWKAQDPTAGKEQGAGKITSAITSLPAYMSPVGLGTMMAGGAMDRGTGILNEGGSINAAATSVGAGLATDAVGAALPIVSKFGAGGAAATGAGANVATDLADREFQNSVREGAGLQQLPEMDGWDIAASAVPGAGVGYMVGRGRGSASSSPDSSMAKLRAEIESETGQGPADSPRAKVPKMNLLSKFHKPLAAELDVPIYGDITKEQLTGRSEESTPFPILPNEIDPLVSRYPQEINAGLIEAGGPAKTNTPLPDLSNIDMGREDLLSLTDSPGTKAETSYARRHDIDTIDFPLRQEVLQNKDISEAIDAFKAQAAELEKTAKNAISPRVRERAANDLATLQNEFAAGMKQLGISKPQDAIGLQKLYEGGTGKTKLPIMKGFDPGNGKGFDRLRKSLAKQDVSLEITKGPVKDIRKADAEEILSFTHDNKPVELTGVFKDKEGNKLGHFELVKHSEGGYEMRDISLDKSARKVNPFIFKNALKEAGYDVKGSDYTTQAGKTLSSRFYANPFDPDLVKSVFKKKPPSYDSFKTQVEAETGPVSDEVARKMYERQWPSQAKSAQINKAINKIPGVDQKYTGEVVPMEQLISRGMDLEDASPAGLYTTKFATEGRLKRDLIDNPVVTNIYNMTTKAVEGAELQARRELDDTETGVIPEIRRYALLGKRGIDGIKDVFKWRYENEGTSNKFSSEEPILAKINEKMDRIYSNLLNGMNDVLVADGGKPIKALSNKMTSYWQGPYRFYVYATTPNGNKKLVTFIAEETAAKAKVARDWMEKNLDPSLTLTDTKFLPGSAKDRTELFDHMVALAGEQDPTVLGALQKLEDTIAKGQTRHKGEQFRQKFKAGVGGYMGNKPWVSDKQNYQDTIKSLQHTVNTGYEWIAAQKIKQQMKPLLKAQRDGVIDTPNAISIGQKYINHALGKNIDNNVVNNALDGLEAMLPVTGTIQEIGSKTNNALNKITVPLMLGFAKYGQYFQSVYQPINMVVPKLQEFSIQGMGSRVNIPKVMSQGFFDGMVSLADNIVGTAGNLAPANVASRKMYNMMDDTGKAIYDYQQEHDISKMTLVDTSSLFPEGGRVLSAANYVSDAALTKVTNILEGPSRVWAHTAMTRYLVDGGMPLDKALEVARENMEVMTNYNPAAKPQIIADMGLAGREAGGLHTFMFNWVSQLMRYKKMAEKNPKMIEPLVSYLAIATAAAGAAGMIGTEMAQLMLDTYKSMVAGTDKDSPEVQSMSVRQWIMENAPDSLSVGPLSTMTGLGLNNSFATKVFDPERSPIENIFPQTTAKVKLAGGILKAHKLFDKDTSELDKGNILESISPASMREYVRKEHSVKGNTILNRNTGEPMYKRTDKEAKIAEEGHGLVALSESLNKEELYRLQQNEKRINQSKSKRLLEFDKAVQEGNKEKLDKVARNLINVWSVDPGTLQQRMNDLAAGSGFENAAQRSVSKNWTFSNLREKKESANLLERMKKRQSE